MNTVNITVRSDTNNQLTVNNWWFVAMTVSATFVPRLFFGNLTDVVSEVSGYATQTTGSTAIITDSGGTGRWGNRDFNDPTAFGGCIEMGGYEAIDWTAAGLKRIQAMSLRGFLPITPYTRILHRLGVNNAGPQIDLSGHALPALVTGATLGLRSPFPLMSPREYLWRFTGPPPAFDAASLPGILNEMYQGGMVGRIWV